MDLAEGLVDLVVGNGSHVGGSVVRRDVPHRSLPVGHGPADVGGAARGDLLVGQDLVDGRAPEVAVGGGRGGAVIRLN